VRTFRPESSQSGDTLGGRDGASLEMHLERVIKQDLTRTWRRSMDGPPGLNSSVS